MAVVVDAGREPVEDVARVGRPRWCRGRRPVLTRRGRPGPARPRRCPGRAGRPASAGPSRRVVARRRDRGPSGRGRRPGRGRPCRRPEPWSAQSSDDLPEPLRPMRATTSPRRRVRSTSRTATSVAVADHDPGRGRTAGPAAGSGRTGGGGPSPASRSRRSGACRRASRTDSGSGDQPASRPSSTTGGAMLVEANSRGRQSVLTDPSPGRWMTRSAYCTTRSSRCSARTTVTPRSWTSRVTAARTSSAAVGSRAEVGSSSTRIRGCAVSTDADRHPLLLAAGELEQRRGAAGRRARAGRGSPRPACASPAAGMASCSMP